MSYPQQLRVDPARLSRIAGEVRDAADVVTSASAAAQGRLAAPGGQEWATTAASRTAQEAWTAFLTALAASVSGLGSDLDTAAKEYTSADQAAAGRVGASGRARAI